MAEDSNDRWAKEQMDLENEILALPPAQRAEALRRAKARLSPEDYQTLCELVKHAPSTPSPPPPRPAATTPSQPFFQTEFLDWRVRPAGGPEYRVADFFHASGMATVWRLERCEPADDAQWPPVLLCKTPTTLTPDPAAAPASAATALAAAQAEYNAEFLAEAGRMQEIEHPDVVRVLAKGILRPPAPDGVLARVRHTLAATGRPCFLMDFPPGSVRLYDWMEDQRAVLPPVEFARQLVAILRTVTEILADLQHRYSLVHGDLSGGNILIVDGRPKLIDFGLAQVVRKHRNDVAAKPTPPGTPGFAPPEQRVQAELHRTSDVYSVAAGLACGLTAAGPLDLHACLFLPAVEITKAQSATLLPRPARHERGEGRGAGQSPPGPLSSPHPTPTAAGGEGVNADARLQPERFRHLPAEDLCAWLTERVLSHGLRQRLLQQRPLLVDLVAGTLIADSQRRFEPRQLDEKLAALETLLAAKHWDDASLRFPAIPTDRPLYGRAAVVAEITDFFHHAGPGPAIVLLQGMGGVGKTATCEKYLHLSRPHPHGGGDGEYPAHPHYDAILWSTACDEGTFVSGIRTYCETLGLAKATTEKGELQLRFRTHLENHPGCLWVINNLDQSGVSADWLAPWLPTAGTCHILITSRPKAVLLPGLAGRTGFMEKHLDPLPEDVAIDYLCRRGRRENLSDREHAFARQIVGPDGLDGLPLAIELAAAYLAVAPHRSLGQYWDLLQKTPGFIDHEFATARDQAGRTGKESLRSVGAAWQPLFALMQREHPAAAALLRLSAVLPADDIPFELLTPDVAWPDEALQQLLAQPDPFLREDALFQQLRELDHHSLIEWNPSAKTWSIHRLVQQVVRGSFTEPQRTGWELAAASGVRHAFTAVNVTNAANLSKGRRLFPAFETVRTVWETRGAEFQPADLATGWISVGIYCLGAARFQTGEDCFHRALAIDEQSHGTEHPNVARDLNNLAQVLLETNRLAAAEPLMRRALAIDEQSYGAEHPCAARHLTSLAVLLTATNRLAEAEPLMRRALAIVEQSYGAEHTNVAIDLNNLAQLLQATNRLAEAEPLQRRALAIDEQSHGAEHPNVARDLNNLAQVLLKTNRLAEAELLMRRALAIDEQSYRAEIPAVATNLCNLAGLLKVTNRLAGAEPLLRRALAIDERSYGAKHPLVASDLNNLAWLLKATNRLGEAEPLQRRALAILVVSLPESDFRSRCVTGNYISLLTALEISEEEGARRVGLETENRERWEAMTPEVERLLGPPRAVVEVLEALDAQYREEGRPAIWFLPLSQPIAPHLDELLGPIAGKDIGAQEKS